jgi:hypothetical protein
LLVTDESSAKFILPKGFVLPNEEPGVALARVLVADVGVLADPAAATTVFDGYAYDKRQTDHAWVEVQAFHFHDYAAAASRERVVGEVAWRPLTAKTVNNIPSGQARCVRDAITRLLEDGSLERTRGEALLARTG